MVFRFGLVLSLTLSLFFGLHYLLYRNLVYLFNITSTNLKTFLLALTIFLSISFGASFLLLFWQRNRYTIGFYIFSSGWFGIFVNLLLGLAAIWLILLLSNSVHLQLKRELVAGVCFAGAALVSFYGFWNAFHPVNKAVKISMRNLPPQWESKKIVFLSDLHIGYVHGTGFLKRVVDQVNNLNPEMIVITGDLFDGISRDSESYIDLLRRFKATQGVFFVVGNHEGYIGLNASLQTIRQTGFKILDNELVEVNGIELAGVSYPGIEDAKEIKNLKTPLANSHDRKPRILLFHTPTNIDVKPNHEKSQHVSAYWGPDTSMSLNRMIGTDLQLSGHTHAGQLFPFTLLTRALFKGYQYGLRREKGFSIYITSGVGTWGPPMRTGCSPEIAVIELARE